MLERFPDKQYLGYSSWTKMSFRVRQLVDESTPLERRFSGFPAQEILPKKETSVML